MHVDMEFLFRVLNTRRESERVRCKGAMGLCDNLPEGGGGGGEAFGNE